MSHTVTLRTQTITTSSTAIIINSGYLATWSGMLKLLQLVLGSVCIGINGQQYSRPHDFTVPHALFFLLITTTFLIGTFILLLSCLLSLSTACTLQKTIYEFLYHSIAFGLYLSASFTFLASVEHFKQYSGYGVMLACAICGCVNAVLYLASAIIHFYLYRRR